MKKVHIGCGKRNFGPDWIHIDGGGYQHVQHHDVVNLPFRKDEISIIYNSHLIAYFDRFEIIMVLHEWKRVLKEGGILRIATPDFEAMAKLYSEGKCTLDQIIGPMYGKMTMNYKNIYHKTTWDFDSLKKILEEVGFKNVRRYDFRNTTHSHIDDHSMAHLPHMDFENGTLISLNIECEK